MPTGLLSAPRTQRRFLTGVNRLLTNLLTARRGRLTEVSTALCGNCTGLFAPAVADPVNRNGPRISRAVSFS